MRYSRSDVQSVFATVWEEIQKLREAGQMEYAHGDSSPFRNFEALAEELGLPREKVLWTYAMKHRDGIVAWLNGHKSQREGVRGRINDLIVYLILLRAMIDETDTAEDPGIIPGKSQPIGMHREHFGTRGLG